MKSAAATRPPLTRETVEKMTATEINRALDRIDREASALNDEFIAAGRGHERPSETWKMSDPLAERMKRIEGDRSTLRNEVLRRYGPGAPYRLPSGFRAKRGEDRELRARTIRLAYERPELRPDLLRALSASETRLAYRPPSMLYFEGLKAKGFRVTPDENVSNRNLANAAAPLAKALDDFSARFAFIDSTVTREEKEALSYAARLVASLVVDRSLLKIAEPEDPPFEL